MRPANGRWRYYVTLSLIGWAHTQNDPCSYMSSLTLDSRVSSCLFHLQCLSQATSSWMTIYEETNTAYNDIDADFLLMAYNDIDANFSFMMVNRSGNYRIKASKIVVPRCNNHIIITIFYVLIHWSQNKMAAILIQWALKKMAGILQITIFKCVSLNENALIVKKNHQNKYFITIQYWFI